MPSAGWSDAAALAALRARRGDAGAAQVAGDMVTLSDGGGFVETRIWDGSGWAPAGEQLNGNSLFRGTVAADALALDGVSIHGDSATGAIRIGRLVAPLITLPTEAGGRFQTHAVDRPITAPKAVDSRTKSVLFGPLAAARDAFAHVHGDLDRRIVAPHDRRGDSADGATNDYFARLFFFQPRFTLVTSYLPTRDNSWGRFVHDMRVRLQLMHGPWPTQLTPFSPCPARLRVGRLSAWRDGRATGSVHGAHRALFTYRHGYRPHPRETAAARGMTAHFEAEIEFQPQIDKRATLTGARLWVKVWIDPQVRGITAGEAFAELARNLTCAGSTLG